MLELQKSLPPSSIQLRHKIRSLDIFFSTLRHKCERGQSMLRQIYKQTHRQMDGRTGGSGRRKEQP